MLFGIYNGNGLASSSWLLVLRQVFVGLTFFGEYGLRISHRLEVLMGYEWKMLWMLSLKENRSRGQIFFSTEFTFNSERSEYPIMWVQNGKVALESKNVS